MFKLLFTSIRVWFFILKYSPVNCGVLLNLTGHANHVSHTTLHVFFVVSEQYCMLSVFVLFMEFCFLKKVGGLV